MALLDRGPRRWVSRAVCAVLAAGWIGLGFGGLLLHFVRYEEDQLYSAGDAQGADPDGDWDNGGWESL